MGIFCTVFAAFLLKLFLNNNLEKVHRERVFGGSGRGNSSTEFSWKGAKKRIVAWRGNGFKKGYQKSVWFLFLLSKRKQHHAWSPWKSSGRKIETDHTGKSSLWSTVLEEANWDATLSAVPPQGRGKSADTAFRQATGQGCLTALDFSLRKEGRSRSQMRVRVAAGGEGLEFRERGKEWEDHLDRGREISLWEAGKQVQAYKEESLGHIVGAGAGLNLLMLFWATAIAVTLTDRQVVPRKVPEAMTQPMSTVWVWP